MKLQACSKVITLNAIGFTLSAAGALFALSSAQQSIDATYRNKVQASASNINSDISHYVHRIDSDYYQLINMSLANVLSLNRDFYLKDPLLSFFERNIRVSSSYSTGEYLNYALDALNYYNIPYFSYDLKDKKLEVHGVKDEAQKQRMLKARAQDGSTLEELIAQPSALNQSFSILYSGTDTYLCLKIFDHVANKNYYALSSYLTVLENTHLDVKKIFSDIDPMMQGILKDDAVMIVRRGQAVFKTNDFDLKIDISPKNLRAMSGVRYVKSDGSIVTDPATLTKDDKASVVAISYIRSINSYIILKRPFNSYYKSDNTLLIARIALVLLALVFMGLIILTVLRSYRDDKKDQANLAALITKITNMSYDDFLNHLKQARAALADEKARKAAASVTSTDATKDANEPATAATGNEADSSEATAQAATANADASAEAGAEQQIAADAVAPDAESSKLSTATASEAATAQAAESDSVSASKTADKSADAEENHSEQAADTASVDTTQGVGIADHVKSESDEETGEEGSDINFAPAQKWTEEDISFIENHILEELLKGSKVGADTLAAEAVMDVIRIGHTAEMKSSMQLSEMLTDFKSRIPVFRKEGQFIAARKMLLNALPSEDAMPSSNFVDFAAFTVPARELSGNFYLIRRIDENNLVFIIGDCCSIGIKAAYTAAVIKTLVDEALRQDLDPPRIMSYINDRLCEERNVTSVGMFIGMISEMTGNVIACNAGHTSPIVIDNNGPHFMCEPNDKRLGRNVGEKFELSKCYLANDDMVLLYSQGIVNVRNSSDELFGMERLLDHCDNSAGLRADELIIRILNDIKQHKGKRPFREDVSLICLKQLRIRF